MEPLMRWYSIDVPSLYPGQPQTVTAFTERAAIRKLVFRRYPQNRKQNLLKATEIFEKDSYTVLKSGIQYSEYFDPALLNNDVGNIKDALEPPLELPETPEEPEEDDHE